jgi:predicted dehydrogenase
MSIVRWGLLSTANINHRLIPAIHESKRGKLVAIASRSNSAAEAYAAHWEIPNAFGSYKEMLDSELVDAVYISLPNHLHAVWSIKSLDAGKHVLCEKPLAISVEEVDQMIEASHRNQRVLAEAFMYRHHPQTKIIGEWVHSGRLGDLSVVRSIFNYSLEKPQDVRLIPDYGGGCLWDVGVYPLSLSQFVFGGPPESVYGNQLLGASGIDETFVGQMQYSNDRFSQISASFRTPFYIYSEIVGTEGRLLINRPFTAFDENPRVEFYPKVGKTIELSIPKKELYLGEVEDMHSAILDGTDPYISIEESRDHIRTVIAMYESANTRKTIFL